MDRLIDNWLPRFDHTEVHSARIAAPPPDVEAALRDLRSSDLMLTRALLGLRALPGRLSGRGPDLGGLRLPLLEGLLASGFVVLDERPGEQIVLGAAGRFWRLRADGIDALAGPQAFRDYDRPASVRAAMDFTVEAEGAGTRLSTETRIAATDAAGRRAFGRYWRIVMPGSALIRRDMLRAVGRRAAATARRRQGDAPPSRRA